MDMGTAPANLASKILAVMAEVEGVKKAGRNDFHKYDYATEADILAAIRGSLITNKLAIVPGVKTATTIGNDVILLDMEFTLIDGDSGESVTTGFIGAGQDKGDKAVYKALTGAEKYFLMKTFLIPTGDDPEREDSRPAQRAAAPASTSAAPRRSLSRPAAAVDEPAPTPQRTASAAPVGDAPPFNDPDGLGYVCDTCGTDIRDSKNFTAAALAAKSIEATGKILCFKHRFPDKDND